MPPHLTNTRLIRYLLLCGLGWISFLVLNYLAPVLIIFILAGILAFLLHYPVTYVQRWLPRGWAITLVIGVGGLLLLGLVSTLGFTVLAQAQDVLNRSQEIERSIVNLLEAGENLLSRLNLSVDFQLIEKFIQNNLLNVTGVAFGAIQQFIYGLGYLVVVVIIALFMLADGARIWWFLIQPIPEPWRGRLTPAVQSNFLGFFWGRFLLSCFFGISILIVFWIMDLPQSLLLAVIGGMFDLIPGIGATLGVALISLIVLPNGLGTSVTVLVVCVIMQQIEENLLMPRVMKDSLNINPVFMFFALLLGARLAGIIGIFLAVPLAGVLVSVLEIEALKGQSHHKVRGIKE
ncbi:AI-2E family transporter [Gloeomargaritales cyanobacterium VI4D9]|nr:AI-2E family transporter [Gloeomargaritales cyanobacterium VI4D9]